MTAGPETVPPTPDAVDGQGRKQGQWTEPDSHGGVMVGAYVDDARDGEWTRWSPKGDLLDRGTFDAGRKVGEWTVFNADGSVKKVTKHRAG